MILVLSLNFCLRSSVWVGSASVTSGEKNTRRIHAPFPPPTMSTFTLQSTLNVPSQISSLALGHSYHLFAGSRQRFSCPRSVLSADFCPEDGSLRVYDIVASKVVKAVRGLQGEVASIICLKRAGSELRDAWVAHGPSVRPKSYSPVGGLTDCLHPLDLQIQARLTENDPRTLRRSRNLKGRRNGRRSSKPGPHYSTWISRSA